MAIFARVAAVILSVMAIHTAPQAHAVDPPSDAARHELRKMIEDVPGATAVRYGLTDSSGRSMDTVKVIQDASGDYLAVYHTMRPDGRFHSALASSKDLLNWAFVRDFGAGTSQPTIARDSKGGYVVAWEQDPNNHIAVRYYPTRAILFSGSASRSFDAPRRLSQCAEGTPNIYEIQLIPDIDRSSITFGGHYFSNCDVDREMRATLSNFSHWSVEVDRTLDNSLLHWGVRGNIGDRDAIEYKGFSYGVIEGQFTKNDFGSWRVFIHDYMTLNSEPLAIKTARGSTAFANPTISKVKLPDGRNAILVSTFLPSEGAALGEAGQLLYYRAY